MHVCFLCVRDYVCMCSGVGACACCTFVLVECLYMLSIQVWVMSMCRMWRQRATSVCLCVCAPIAAMCQRLKSCSEPSASTHRSNLATRVTDSFPPLPEKLRDPNKQRLVSYVRPILVLEKNAVIHRRSVGPEVSFKVCFSHTSVQVPHTVTPTISPRHYVYIVLICFARSTYEKL